MAATFKGPDPGILADGRYQCMEPGCDRIFPTEQGTKAHWSREHNGGGKRSLNGHANDIFVTLAKVTKALVADAPDELYDRMEEIVEVRKIVARYLTKRYSDL